MSLRKVGNKWKIDFRVGKRRCRHTAKTRTECIRYRDNRIATQNSIIAGHDPRTLEEIIRLWYKSRGVELVDNQRTLNQLLRFCEIVNNPIAQKLTPQHWHHFKSVKRDQGMGDKSLNNILSYVNAVYNFLHKNGMIDYSNPLRSVEKMKLHERELTYLTTGEIATLFRAIKDQCINKHVYMITKICLSTGARWGEIESRKLHHFQDNQVRLTFTKSKKNRVIPIEPELYKEIIDHIDKYGEFTNSQEAFRRALIKSGVRTVRGQASHILRHTFASHFMMNGGNIRVLQTILGHSDIKVTEKYAKFSPDHLTDAVRLNPLKSVDT